ncbi:YbaB/EbfC family nucleoid-associated protein [Saccharopolyspora sp. CA-218241]|uniref:YbaB/EbfC family nucleoid-associated protein n=1 Tax=Saccharopolyspora sp. CA-218241 TaxID=3240027 RepID=UPI003D980D01
MQPDDWLAQYNTKLQQLKADTDRAKEQLGGIGGSATSRDGQVTVRVNGSGVLEDISFSRDFPHPKPNEVAASIMECVRKAQRDAAGRTMDVMQQFVGEGDAMDFVRNSLPHGYAGDGSDEDDQPVRRREAAEPEDFDNTDEDFLR